LLLILAMNSTSAVRFVRNTLYERTPPSVRRFLYQGTERYCVLCESSLRRFCAAGLNARPDASCPVCNSLERHRLLKLVTAEKTDLFSGSPKRVLHIAPEDAIERLVRTLPGVRYLSADLEEGRAAVRMDITNIQYPDASFDVVLCSHVLEHVPDDRKALQEFYRVLSPEGWAVIQVPIVGTATFENPSITDPEERLRAFGQRDHVRQYGCDFRDRIREARFAVEEITTEDMTSEDEARKMGLVKGDRVYLCRKNLS
jgi:SAM-dependent methyltransferase